MDYEIAIEPMEPLLFGDNRSARAGVDHLQLDQDPSPLTLFGAVGQLLIERFGPWPTELLGERQDDVLEPGDEPTAELLGFCHRNAAGEPVFPKPRHLRFERVGERSEALDLLSPQKGEATRISWQDEWPRVLEPPAGTSTEIDEDESELFVDRHGLGEILCHRLPEDGLGTYRADDLYRAEGRPGISVDNRSCTVFEGQFFTRPYRRFQPPKLDPRQGQGGFTAWYRTLSPLPEKLADPIGFLGGDRRRARFGFTPCEAPGDALATLRGKVVQAAKREESAGFVLYLLTPLLATDEPLAAAGERPVAAALGPSVHVSGWDVAQRCPRPIRALVPAGSVFFFDWPAGTSAEDRARHVRRLWLRPLRKLGAMAGFGRCLVGIWR